MYSHPRPVKKAILLFVVWAQVCISYAQQPLDYLNELNEKRPQQTLYLHRDRNAYAAGDTIWFKAYTYSDFNTSSLSSNLFVQLVDKQGVVISSKQFPLPDGKAFGYFALSATLAQDIYILRAYTPWMLNSGPGTICQSAVPVLNDKKRNTAPAFTPVERLRIIPESGKLIPGKPNKLYIRTTDKYGRPLAARGTIRDKDGTQTTSFQTDSRGMDRVDITAPVSGDLLGEAIFSDQTSVLTSLKVPPAGAWVVSTTPHAKGIQYTILPPAGFTGNTDGLLLAGHMQQYVVLEQNIRMNNGTASGVIPVQDLFPGLLHLSLFNNQHQLLAEKTVVVAPEKYRFTPGFMATAINPAPKEKNEISFTFPDSVQGTFSLSITDADRDFLDLLPGNIMSSLWLDNHTKEKVWANPDLFYTAEPRQLEQTGGLYNWEKPDWTKAGSPVPPAGIRDHNFLAIKGSVFKEGTNKPEGEGELLFVVVAKDSSRSFINVPVNAAGRFDADNFLFSDTAQFYYRFTDKKNKEKLVTVQSESTDPLPSSFSFTLPHPSVFAAAAAVFHDSLYAAKAKEMAALAAGDFAHAQILSEVVVQTKKKSPAQVVNDQYSKGLFNSMSRSSLFDFINNPVQSGALNVFEYLQGKIAGLIINRSKGGYEVWSPRSISMSGGPVPAKIYIDEMEADVTEAMLIPMSNIAMVKYFPPHALNFPGIGIAPAIVVYTKKGGDAAFASVQGLGSFRVPGYATEQPFNQVAYGAGKSQLADHRITLLWEPDFYVPAETRTKTVSFYTSDQVRRIRVRLEGISTDGRLVAFEKILE